MKINYALQTYDVASNSCFDRYCTNDKKELVHKCISSFFQSVKHAADANNDVFHNVEVFDNGSTEDTINLVNRAINLLTTDNFKIKLNRINSGSMINSIRICFNWMKDSDADLVYLVQDDFLFVKNGIIQMIDIFNRFHLETGHPPIVYPFNVPDNLLNQYRLRSTPRLIHPGSKQYWIQNYDISCTFMIHRDQLIRNWKWIEYFMSIDQVEGLNGTGDLENISLNKIMVDEKVLCLMPFESVALHMQGEREKDPYIDWKQRWDSIKLI